MGLWGFGALRQKMDNCESGSKIEAILICMRLNGEAVRGQVTEESTGALSVTSHSVPAALSPVPASRICGLGLRVQPGSYSPSGCTPSRGLMGDRLRSWDYVEILRVFLDWETFVWRCLRLRSSKMSKRTVPSDGPGPVSQWIMCRHGDWGILPLRESLAGYLVPFGRVHCLPVL